MYTLIEGYEKVGNNCCVVNNEGIGITCEKVGGGINRIIKM